MDISLHYLTMANHLLIQKRILEKVKESGLTLGQPKVLDYLKNHDGASQKEIAAGCFIEAGSLTSILNRMEEKGLIQTETVGRTRHYTPAVERRSAAARETRSFLDKVYQGSVGLMVSAMAQDKALSREEIDQLYEILKQAEANKP
mgnify:CR=1 FL=1